MKAIVQRKYGGPDVLQLADIDMPEPKENEVLVKVYATAINDYDWGMMRGKPYLYRMLFGVFTPKHPVMGMELSGVVAAVGRNVTLFSVGDAVYGDISDVGFGTFTEYACIDESALALKPADMSFTDAASIPHASLLAWQGLVDVGDIQQGQKILINGAGGGVGTYALHIAKSFGAHVTGVDTGDKLEAMSAMGYDEVIDYKEISFIDTGEQYDIILDAKSKRSPFACLRGAMQVVGWV